MRQIKPIKRTIILGLALLLSSISIAGQKQKNEPCADAQTQTDMNICWGKEYKSADARLNAVYREFTSKLSAEETAQLKAVQIAWLKFRDINCEFVADQYKGGSIRPMIAAICLAEVTDTRTNELKAQMKQREEP